MMLKPITKGITAALTLLTLSACSLIKYQPLETIDKVDYHKGYRFESVHRDAEDDDTFIVLMFSGGGTRAAALGYGVLEQLHQQKVRLGNQTKNLLNGIDTVVGVSGGSVLAAYFALHGEETIPSFNYRFLNQNFQRMFAKQVFSAANIPRLSSSEYGRGDLLQEQFENLLFKKATFGDLLTKRKGPFAIISATDMGSGERINFTQEYFDAMCLNLNKLRIARAVAASSAVPLVFAPLTLNNNGGNCGYEVPKPIQTAIDSGKKNSLQKQTRREVGNNFLQYGDSQKRPFIHLIDGGLTDNLGLRSLLDLTDVYSENMLTQQLQRHQAHRLVVINVNAQNQIESNIDKKAAIPGMGSVIDAIINIPIDKYSQDSLRRFRAFADKWNESKHTDSNGKPISLSFISLNLRDLPESELRNKVLAIPTSFYLPSEDINNLRQAAAVLMKNSKEYNKLLAELAATPDTAAIKSNQPDEFVIMPDFKEIFEEEDESAAMPSESQSEPNSH